MTEATICSVCLQTLKAPRALPCGHLYCGPPKECFETLKESEESVKCAICKAVHVLDVDENTPLYGSKNFLNEEAKLLTTEVGPNFSKCEVHQTEQIFFWCIKCSCKLCQKCLENKHDGHPMRTYNKHLQKEVKDLFAGYGGGKDGFKNEMKKIIESYQEGIALLRNKIGCIREIDEMERKKKTCMDLMENESKLRAFSNGSSDVDFRQVDVYLSFLNESSLPIALSEKCLLVHRFSMKAIFEDINSWKVDYNHYSTFFLINNHKFRLRAKKFRNDKTETHFFALYLNCSPLHYKRFWEYRVKTYSLSLKNSRDGESDLVETVSDERKYNEKGNSMGFNDFIEWEELLKSNFLWNKNAKPFISVQCTIELIDP